MSGSTPLPAGLQPLELFVRARRTMTRDQFLGAYPSPVLLVPRLPGLGDGGDFATRPMPMVDRSQPRDDARLVIPVAKRVADAFPTFIWVGREPQCDVSLPFDGLSKLHAQFVKKPGGELELLDTSSSNGTYVDGVRLEGNRAVKMNDGARIKLGTLEVVFRTPDGFWGELAAMDGRTA